MVIVHQGVRQSCGQDVLHLSLLLSDMFLPRLFFLRSGARVVSAVAPLSARRRRCSHCRRRCRCGRPTVLTSMLTQSSNLTVKWQTSGAVAMQSGCCQSCWTVCVCLPKVFSSKNLRLPTRNEPPSAARSMRLATSAARNMCASTERPPSQ